MLRYIKFRAYRICKINVYFWFFQAFQVPRMRNHQVRWSARSHQRPTRRTKSGTYATATVSQTCPKTSGSTARKSLWPVWPAPTCPRGRTPLWKKQFADRPRANPATLTGRTLSPVKFPSRRYRPRMPRTGTEGGTRRNISRPLKKRLRNETNQRNQPVPRTRGKMKHRDFGASPVLVPVEFPGLRIISTIWRWRRIRGTSTATWSAGTKITGMILPSTRTRNRQGWSVCWKRIGTPTMRVVTTRCWSRTTRITRPTVHMALWATRRCHTLCWDSPTHLEKIGAG